MRREAVHFMPKETGGMLLGYVRSGRGHLDFVVTARVAGGPRAEHQPDRFVPDGDWQQRKLERAYRDSGRVASYLGDWHSHPTGGLQPSRIDRRTAARVAATKAARAPIPVCLILSATAVACDARVYTFERKRFRTAELLITEETTPVRGQPA